MSDRDRPAVFTIPSHRSFADALAAGLIRRFGKDPLGLARGRLLLPNNRAVRSVTEAFVRASGQGLLLPRLIAIGDPELDERIGGALEGLDDADIPPAIDPLERQLTLATIVRGSGALGSAESLRLSSDLAATLDALQIEDIAPSRLRDVVDQSDDVAGHWQKSLLRLQAIVDHWPGLLEQLEAIDLAERRNRLLKRLARRWADSPPPGFTVAAGVTTAAPAVAALLARVARMDGGMVVVPGLWLGDVFPDEEWEALGPNDDGLSEPTHPQYHLKLLLDRIGIARGEVELWRDPGGAASSPARALAAANAMTAPRYSDKWESLPAGERRLSGVRLAELPDAAAEAQAVALALREAIEAPGRTAALVTPDRVLASRVSALLKRWGIDADDSAGRPLAQTAPATLLLGLAAAAAEDFAPVALFALAKHPLAGGEGVERRNWLDRVRLLDRALRGPRPPPGLAGLDALFAEKKVGREWAEVRPRLAALDGMFAAPVTLARFAAALAQAAQELAGDAAWSGAAGRMAAELLAEIEASPAAARLALESEEAVPVLRQLLDQHSVRPPYGGHPRIFIWGLLEARLQRADLLVLGGLNEGSWPPLPTPDPWLPPRVRAKLGMPTLDSRIGLAAQDFAGALGAPQVLITRAARDSRSPTVKSRLLLRLEAVSGGLERADDLVALALTLDNPGNRVPATRPQPSPPASLRPKSIYVTAVDRLNADPFAFYAREMLRLKPLDPVDSDATAAWKGSAVHDVFDAWLKEDHCDPAKLLPRARALLAGEAVHPLLRALWQPRLLAAIAWMAEEEAANQRDRRLPVEGEVKGEAMIAGVTLKGRADRIDRFADRSLAIIDYKTGHAPAPKAVEAGFALQLGLLGLIASEGGFPRVSGVPSSHEYWSLAKKGDHFGYCRRLDAKIGAEAFLESTRAAFTRAAEKYLTGDEPFKAKLNPAYAWAEYDQLMRLEEWYGRE